MPAAWCGIVGLKPTHGLVPYTGAVPLDATIDHLGPLTRDVADCARVLDAIAGPDGIDARQTGVEPDDYAGAVASPPPVGDLTVGVLEEGFDREGSEDAVDGAVRGALDALDDAGATVTGRSVPWHADGGAILTGIAVEGTAALARNDGVNHFAAGPHDPDLAGAFGRARRSNADDFPPMMKFATILGQYLADQYQGRYYATAQNLARDLRANYDAALEGVDVLALPTTPHAPHEVRAEATMREAMDRSLSMNGNTSPFNGTGHPAITLPCGEAAGLPVGLMLVGDRFGDAALLGAAAAVEAELDAPFDAA
jgi:amidase